MYKNVQDAHAEWSFQCGPLRKGGDPPFIQKIFIAHYVPLYDPIIMEFA